MQERDDRRRGVPSLREEMARLEQERKDKEAEERRLGEAFRNVAATPDGQRVLRWLINQGELFSDEFSPNAGLAYNVGVRAIARRLWNKLKVHASRNDFIAICIGEKSDV